MAWADELSAADCASPGKAGKELGLEVGRDVSRSGE